MAEVFISYARKDKGFVRDIHAALQKVNRDTWIDWRSIPDSAKWRAEIFAAIEAADNFLFVISPDSVNRFRARTTQFVKRCHPCRLSLQSQPWRSAKPQHQAVRVARLSPIRTSSASFIPTPTWYDPGLHRDLAAESD